ncbi:cellulose synthase family protein [Spirosoma foliorum]|uniref:Glycosyltransferase n=1 Tax=Spirosoma foliorum TaxID=2710596 RepID=A0A7G5GRT7_9BACT|nr:cellulose synthase family protein [Spirosoma foliorum]QMW01579.1 glycosyltransferase [Spirosoma foliorum]
MEILVLLLYGLALMLLFFYNCGQLSLILIYLRSKRKRLLTAKPASVILPVDLPRVTVQLPVYNELYVVDRLIDAVVQLNYPKDKLDIQILDDSTDETVWLIARKVATYQQLGFDIQHIQRPDRTGFKAGALAYGLNVAKGEFIAIFDADFVPDPEFLIKAIPHFTDPQVAIVQTRWGHLNEEFSLLTQLQAFGLNAHFTIEQSGRHTAGLLANFNGTGGIWRKEAITDAGGWQSDTLTEDLDLSYRAQLKGWKFVYREDINSPAELPVAMNALKSQQYRWMKGAAECARKLIGRVLRTPNLSLTIKLHALFHLFSSASFILVLILGVMSVPLLYIRSQHPEWEWAFRVINLFQANLFILIAFYGIPLWFLKSNSKAKLLWYFPMYSSLMMGLSLHNTIAVIEGYLGRRTPFIRTPKFNVKTGSDQWSANKYVSHQLNWMTMIEGLFAAYFLGGLVLAIYLQDYRLFFLHLMFMVGFGMVSMYSLYQANYRLTVQQRVNVVKVAG